MLLFAASALALAGVLLVFAAQVRDSPSFDRRDVREQVDRLVRESGLPGPVARDQVFEQLTEQELEARTDRRTLVQLRNVALGGLLGLLILSAIIGYVVSGFLLRPVSQIASRARALYDRAPDLSGRIGLGGPDDELREIADTFDAFLDRTETAMDSQRRFLADASHELRTPITTAQTNLDVVLDHEDAEIGEFRHAATVARDQLRRMGQLVSDLLFIERSGTRGEEKVALDALISGSLDDLRPRADAREITLSAEPGDLEVRLRAEDLRRAVTNLVENAIVHNRPGGRVVIDTEAVNGVVRIGVTDDGPGIDPSEHEAIFRRFHRAGHGEGSGLGLAIVRELMERMGGSVHVEIPPDGGARFVLSAPLSGASSAPT